MKRVRHVELQSAYFVEENDSVELKPSKQTESNEIDIDLVVFKCIEWFIIHPEYLPRTLSEFSSVVDFFCQQTLSVDVDVILGHLLLNNVFMASPIDGLLVPTLPLQNGIRIFVPTESNPSESEPTKVSSEFIKTLTKVINWVQSSHLQLSCGVSITSLKSILKELCVIPYTHIPPQVVMNHFQQRGIISLDVNHNITFMLPNKPFKRSYYMPCCLESFETSISSENDFEMEVI